MKGITTNSLTGNSISKRNANVLLQYFNGLVANTQLRIFTNTLPIGSIGRLNKDTYETVYRQFEFGMERMRLPFIKHLVTEVFSFLGLQKESRLMYISFINEYDNINFKEPEFNLFKDVSPLSSTDYQDDAIIRHILRDRDDISSQEILLGDDTSSSNDVDIEEIDIEGTYFLF